jgi:hypothetical protein
MSAHYIIASVASGALVRRADGAVRADTTAAAREARQR